MENESKALTQASPLITGALWASGKQNKKPPTYPDERWSRLAFFLLRPACLHPESCGFLHRGSPCALLGFACFSNGGRRARYADHNTLRRTSQSFRRSP